MEGCVHAMSHPMPALHSFMQCMPCYSASAVILATHALHRCAYQGRMSSHLLLLPSLQLLESLHHALIWSTWPFVTRL